MIHPATDEIISFLNSLLELDREAITQLVLYRVECNSALADHPTVQVDKVPSVGLLGILNGFCGSVEFGDRAGWGAIAAVFETDTTSNILRFERLQ